MVTAVAALLSALAGCSLSSGGRQKADQKAHNDAEAAAIQDQLADIPGVVEVEVRYSDFITEPGAGTARLRVEPGTDLERIAEMAIEAIWRSRLEPLNSIKVAVGDGDGRDYLVLGKRDNPRDKTAELEAKWSISQIR